MSLIGSLEDLNLGDILQIIYLSQKSGVLVIRSGEGEGRIVFRDGLVCGGSTESGPVELRDLLVGGGLVAADAFDVARAACADAALDLEAELVQRQLIEAEGIDSARREHIEAAVNQMFRWETGEFSFDLQRETDPADVLLLLAKGINPQFLAMERVRLEDESGRGGEFEDEDEMSAEEMFGVVSDDPPPAEPEALPRPEAFAASPPATAAIALDLGSVDEDFGTAAELLEADLLEPTSSLLEQDESLEPLEGQVQAPPAAPHETTATLGEPVQPSPAFGLETRSTPVIVIEDDLVALEWTKKALTGPIKQVHIFQRSDLGLSRIRQYLARGVAPMLLLSPDIAGDPTGGIKDASDFVRRLKAQSAGIRVMWLCEDGGSNAPASNPADGVLVRPTTRDFRSPAAARVLDGLATQLRDDLARLTGAEASPNATAASGASTVEATTLPPAPRGTSSPSEIERALAVASSRGEILPLVIRFARESFARVAMFVVRDGVAMGIAQSGLSASGGPDDEGMRGLNLEVDECSWLRDVLTSRQPRLAEPSDSGDFKLAALLGDRVAEEAYLAPIQSGGEVVALLYADNLPSGEPIGDTTRIEAALAQAGEALDRAVRERTAADEVIR